MIEDYPHRNRLRGVAADALQLAGYEDDADGDAITAISITFQTAHQDIKSNATS